MIDVINRLLKELYLKIPNEVLMLAFEPDKELRSLDAVIKEKVIVDHVLSNCNLYSGRPKRISLQESWLKDIKDHENYIAVTGDYCIFQVPEEAREYRDIVAVVDVSYPTVMAFSTPFPMQQLEGNSVASGVDDALSSMTRTPTNVTPSAVVMGNNVIKLDPPMATWIEWSMLCWLALDEDFSNISPNMIKPLSKMTLYACQMYIYNKMNIRLNQGMLVGGQNLEAIKRVVDRYEDAEDKFDEALMKLRGASVLQANQIGHLLAQCL